MWCETDVGWIRSDGWIIKGFSPHDLFVGREGKRLDEMSFKALSRAAIPGMNPESRWRDVQQSYSSWNGMLASWRYTPERLRAIIDAAIPFDEAAARARALYTEFTGSADALAAHCETRGLRVVVGQPNGDGWRCLLERRK